jgi:general secretion pathway protein I
MNTVFLTASPSCERKLTQDCQRGFTLIEVLLALVVFSLSFGLILETLGTASNNVRVADDVGRVALLAQNYLDSVGIEQAIKPGTTAGKLDNVYRYELTISDYRPEDTTVSEAVQIKMYQIEMRVIWGSGRNERVERFSTLRAVQLRGRN